MNGANPVGHWFRVEATPSDPETAYEIVGLVKNTKYQDLREPFGPIAFFPTSQEQRPDAGGQFLIRSSLPQGEITAAVKRVIALNEVIVVKPKLSEYGATEDAIPSMSKDAMQSGNILVNPRETKLEDIEALYRAAL